MGIEINQRLPLAEVNRSANKPTASAQDKNTATTNVASDSVSLSTEAVFSKLESTPEVNSTRVNQLKNAIADGSYTVDSHKLAGNIIQSETDLAAFE